MNSIKSHIKYFMWLFMFSIIVLLFLCYLYSCINCFCYLLMYKEIKEHRVFEHITYILELVFLLQPFLKSFPLKGCGCETERVPTWPLSCSKTQWHVQNHMLPSKRFLSFYLTFHSMQLKELQTIVRNCNVSTCTSWP